MITWYQYLNLFFYLLCEGSFPLIEIDIPRHILTILRQVSVTVSDIFNPRILALPRISNQT